MKLKSAGMFFLLIAISCAVLQAQNTETQEKPVVVKLHPVVFGGNRYVVNADFGTGESVPMMVHGNARLYMMITHEIAEKLNHGKPIPKLKEYGYSEKGMGKIDIPRVSIGGKTFLNITNVSVFDWPVEEGKAARGMLGIDFLKKERVKIDFEREEMETGVAVSNQPEKNLLENGYLVSRFYIENGESFMPVYFEALNREVAITVGTVSDEYSFDLVTFCDAVKLEKTGETGHSPNNTRPAIYVNSEPLTYKIAGHRFSIAPGKAEIYSMAEYEHVQQSELFPFGILGRDWMKENHAIIDYANLLLYFKPDTQP